MIALLIEDDPHKSHQIAEYLSSEFLNLELIERRSYQSGMREIVATEPPIVLLDMTLPTFDVSDGESGGRMRAFGGRDILVEIQKLCLPCVVLIVTQFETFGEGEELQTLEQMVGELCSLFPDHYRGTVYYHPARSDWRDKLKTMLLSLIHGAPN